MNWYAMVDQPLVTAGTAQVSTTTPFNVKIICEVTALTFATIATSTYDIASGVPTFINLPDFTVTPAVCKPLIKWTWTKKDAAEPILYSIDEATQTIKVQTGLTADIGSKTLNIVATMVPNPKVTGVTSPANIAFTVNVMCLATNVVLKSPVIQSYTYIVNTATATTLTFANP